MTLWQRGERERDGNGTGIIDNKEKAERFTVYLEYIFKPSTNCSSICTRWYQKYRFRLRQFINLISNTKRSLNYNQIHY